MFVERDISKNVILESAELQDELAGGRRRSQRRRVKNLRDGEDVLGDMWNLDRIDDVQGLDGTYEPQGSGAGVHVYVLDTGLRSENLDFEGRATKDADCSAPGNCVACADDSPTCCRDLVGHGTHVAGTIAGKLVGVAKLAAVHGVKVFPQLIEHFIRQDGIKWSTVMKGLDWVIHNALKPAVINLSLGGKTGQMKSHQAAIDGTNAAGIAVVVAAGNTKMDACGYGPAWVPEAITVSSISKEDEPRNAYGECVDIRAPGENIMSTWSVVLEGELQFVMPSDLEEPCIPDACMRPLTGSSMASPHVAGAAAILLGNEGSLSAAEVKSKLLDAATITANGDKLLHVVSRG